MRSVAISALVFLTLGAGGASAATLKPLATEGAWNSPPIFATAPQNDRRLFVVERGTPDGVAAIRVFEDGVLNPTPFLSIPNVNLEGERGLLSMAFAPDYPSSGLFYVFYIADGSDSLDPAGVAGDIRIVEYRRSPTDPDLADPASARLLLKQPHSAKFHNSGWMAFGPDGYLYATIGDNWEGADGQIGSDAQRLENLFGKVIRIDPGDPDGAGPASYGIPPGNPFVSTAGARREIYTLGLRNPFRASFTPTGDLAVADVGYAAVEELDVGDLAGKNMGWPVCEGFCPAGFPQFTDPFFAFRHADGYVAIIGGYVVRDPDLGELTGRYLFGDFQGDDLQTLNLSDPGGDLDYSGLSIPESNENLLSFGQDSYGCLYVLTNLNTYRVAADSAASPGCPHESPVPDPPTIPIGSTAMELELSGKPQRLRKRFRFFAKCSKSCAIESGGELRARIRGRARTTARGKPRAVRFRFRPVVTESAAGTKVKIVLRLKRRALRNARRVSRNGRRLRAVVFSTASDAARNASSDRLRLRVRRR